MHKKLGRQKQQQLCVETFCLHRTCAYKENFLKTSYTSKSSFLSQVNDTFKVTPRPELKFQPFISYSYVDGRSEKIFRSTLLV